MKTTSQILQALLVALLLITPSIQAATKIKLEARFVETDNKNREDILSSPAILLLAGEEGLIEIVREILLVPTSPTLQDHVSKVETGISLAVCPVALEDGILLKGTATVSEAPEDALSVDINSAWISLREVQTTFVLRLEPGEWSHIPALSLDEKTSLRIELKATVIPRENAATVYWQAFAALPPEPDSDDAAGHASWIAEAAPALRLLQQAAAQPHCDWQLDYTQGVAMTLPHISKLRALGRAACARAHAKENPGEASADLIAALRMSRHAGSDPVLISQLVRAAIQENVLDAFYDLLPELDHDQLTLWATTLQTLPPVNSLAECLAAERKSFVSSLRNQTGLDPADLWDLLGASQPRQSAPKAEVLQDLLDTLEKDYQELEQIATLPPAELRPAFDAWMTRTKAGGDTHILSLLMAPAIDKSAERLHRSQQDLLQLQQDLKSLPGHPGPKLGTTPQVHANWVKEIQKRREK